jgi:hypothetical protein
MHPALAARIEASVSGRKGGDGDARRRPLLVAIARLALVMMVAAVVLSVIALRRRDRRELEAMRAALLDKVRAGGASLTADDLRAVERAESWIERAAGAYEGDLVADELRRPGAFAATLARPAVYVRGPIGALASAARISEALSASFKDPFVACLVDPPAARTEKTLLPRVRAAYARGADEHTANVRRLRDAEVGLPFLQPPWAERVRAAPGPEDLERLQADFERAPLEAARRAAKADLLLVAIDEPGDPAVPAELDGERPHQVRVELVDLASAKVLLRLRKGVDPGWISAAKRSELASGLDGCALAMDVRAAAAL